MAGTRDGAGLLRPRGAWLCGYPLALRPHLGFDKPLLGGPSPSPQGILASPGPEGPSHVCQGKAGVSNLFL